jgi:RNA polymerase sigma-70 factor (ECF subfamily)
MQDLSSELSLAQDDSLDQANDRNVLAGALAGLSADHRLVVTLRYYRDLTIDEIARQVGVRPGTVDSRLHYALKRMRAALEEADAKETVR